MRPLDVPTKEQVDSKAQEIFTNLENKLGMVPNIYATIGYNSNVLNQYMQFDSSVGKSFSNKEIEVIKLAVSEVNGCAYCLAAHTAVAKQNGFSDDETLQIRRAETGNVKYDTLSRIAAKAANNAGRITEEDRDAFFDLGYKEEDLIDFLAVILGITFTNYVHNATEIPVDFPEAQPLEELVEA